VASPGIIRQFRPPDAGACVALVRDCVARAGTLSEPVRSRLWTMQSEAKINAWASEYYMVVSELEGRIAGVGGVQLNEIRLLYVAPELQGCGLGGDLLRHLESMVTSPPFSDAFVYSSLEAVGFYRRRGFKVEGDFSFDLGDGLELPTVFMRKPLLR
jgi:N-acetylglutamate synthase-like GNAT family acetyltransferase